MATYQPGDVFRIPGFPMDTLLILGALIRLPGRLDVAAVAILNVPGFGPGGGSGEVSLVPVTLTALDASQLIPVDEHAELPDDFVAGVLNWLGSDENHGSAFTLPIRELLSEFAVRLRER